MSNLPVDNLLDRLAQVHKDLASLKEHEKQLVIQIQQIVSSFKNLLNL